MLFNLSGSAGSGLNNGPGLDFRSVQNFSPFYSGKPTECLFFDRACLIVESSQANKTKLVCIARYC